MEGGWTPNLTLECNEYQSYILKFASNVVQKLCDLLGGRGGGHQKITLDHRGEGGGQDGQKKDHIIFERSLNICSLLFPGKTVSHLTRKSLLVDALIEAGRHGHVC